MAGKRTKESNPLTCPAPILCPVCDAEIWTAEFSGVHRDRSNEGKWEVLYFCGQQVEIDENGGCYWREAHWSEDHDGSESCEVPSIKRVEVTK